VTCWAVVLRRGPASGSAAGTEPGSLPFVIEESLGYLVNRVARMMAGELAERLRPAGIGIGPWAILLLLWSRNGSTQAELARFAAIEGPTVVRTIDRMVRDGLVTRQPDPGDARLSRIELTERGTALRDELIPQAIAVNDAFLQRLTSSEGEDLRRLLSKLLENPVRP
jgi:DNA-binding MarR family transcriptional regulator